MRVSEQEYAEMSILTVSIGPAEVGVVGGVAVGVVWFNRDTGLCW